MILKKIKNCLYDQLTEYYFYIFEVIVYACLLLRIDMKLTCFGVVMIPISFSMKRVFGQRIQMYESKLIARVYSPKSGQIFIDNMDIQKIDRNNYYKNVGVVSQESVLFNMSIIDNLRLANAHISEDDIEKICSKFPFLNFINDLEDGLHTVIGEGGAKLSGGQRQMLLFIRVMIQNPEVVVLDETTSALDEVTESQVLDFIKEAWSEKTVIFITHRKNVVDSFEERIEVADKQVRFYESIFCHE